MFTEKGLGSSIDSISIGNKELNVVFGNDEHALMIIGTDCSITFKERTKFIVYFISSECTHGVYPLGGKENEITFDVTQPTSGNVCAFIPSYSDGTIADFYFGKSSGGYDSAFNVYYVPSNQKVETTGGHYYASNDVYGLQSLAFGGRYYFKRERISSEEKFLSGCVSGGNVKVCTQYVCNDYLDVVRVTYGSCSTGPNFVIIAVIIVVVVVIIIITVIVLICLGCFGFICKHRHHSSNSNSTKEPVYQPTQCYQQPYYQSPPNYQQQQYYQPQPDYQQQQYYQPQPDYQQQQNIQPQQQNIQPQQQNIQPQQQNIQPQQQNIQPQQQNIQPQQQNIQPQQQNNEQQPTFKPQDPPPKEF